MNPVSLRKASDWMSHSSLPRGCSRCSPLLSRGASASQGCRWAVPALTFVASLISSLLGSFRVPGTVDAAATIRRPRPLRACALGPQTGRALLIILSVSFPCVKSPFGLLRQNPTLPLAPSPVLRAVLGQGTVPTSSTPCSLQRAGFSTEAREAQSTQCGAGRVPASLDSPGESVPAPPPNCCLLRTTAKAHIPFRLGVTDP